MVDQESAAFRTARQRNEQTRYLTTYTQHRQRIKGLIQAAAESFDAAGRPSEVVSILGAGNCLDVDLRFLTERFQCVQLLDLDSAAMQFGVENHFSAGATSGKDRIHPVCLDLGSPLSALTSETFADEREFDRACRELRAVWEVIPARPADLVVSTCVLSQMIDAASETAGHRHPRLMTLLQELRRGHFQRMCQLLKPGGLGLFVSDIVSSETTPVLEQVSENQLPTVLMECLARGNFFAGLHPGVVVQELQTLPEFQQVINSVTVHSPWNWHMGHRVYAVYAVSFSRKH